MRHKTREKMHKQEMIIIVDTTCRHGLKTTACEEYKETLLKKAKIETEPTTSPIECLQKSAHLLFEAFEALLEVGPELLQVRWHAHASIVRQNSAPWWRGRSRVRAPPVNMARLSRAAAGGRLGAVLRLFVGANGRGFRGGHLQQQIGRMTGRQLVLALRLPHVVLEVAQALQHDRVLGISFGAGLRHFAQFLLNESNTRAKGHRDTCKR